MIEIAKTDDAVAIFALESQAIACPWTLEQITDAIQNPAYVFLTARTDGTVIGYASARRIEDEAEINNIAVAVSQRGRGVGNLLLTNLIEQTRARGANTFFLEVACDNHAAIALYQKHGFQKIATRRNYYPDNTDAWVYQKIFA